MLRHIAWFNEGPIEPDPKGGLRSDDERVRRRCLDPACALEDKGISCSVFGNLQDADPAEVGQLLQKLKTDIVVIGAFSDPTLLKLAQGAKHLGCYVIADFADQTTLHGDFEKLADIADQVVAATPATCAFLKSHEIESVLIEDGAPDVAAEAWLACFKTLKMKPPACANSNLPPAGHG